MKTPTLRSLGATILAAVVGVSIAPAALIPPASAERHYLKDADNPAITVGDITKVQVDHRRGAVEAKTTFEEFPGTGLDVFYDTRPANPGPEFHLHVTVLDEFDFQVETNDMRLRRVDTFNTWKGKSVKCSGDRASRTKKFAIFTHVPRKCLAIDGKQPGRVRIAVRVTGNEDYYDPPGVTDWAPRHRVFGPWLRRG